MRDNLIIPEDIIVGLQNRRDSLTEKLGFVTFNDGKIIRQEKTWNSWRDQKQEPLNFKNEPTSGFILNKGVKRYGYYGSGSSKIRVYDPRGFEFEISVDNLMFVLMHSDVSKQDIQEKCIYAWQGKNIVLLPINSEEYQESIKYTNKRDKKISAKELVIGHTYSHKKEKNNFVYIGRYDYYYVDKYNIFSPVKDHVFYNIENDKFEIIKINLLAELISDKDDSSVSDLIETFKKSIHGSAIKKFKLGSFNNFNAYDNQYYYRKSCYLFKILEDLKIEKISIQYVEIEDKKYISSINNEYLLKGLNEFEKIYDTLYQKEHNDKFFVWKRDLKDIPKKFEGLIELQNDHYGQQYFLNFDKIIQSYLEQGYSDTLLVELDSESIQALDYFN